MKRKSNEFNDEGDVKKAVKKVLGTYPELHFDMPPASQYGVSGRHDFLIWQCGFGWTIETKFGDNKPTPGQCDFARDIQKAGSISLLINEKNIWEVRLVADYIAANKRIPHWMNHAFQARRTVHKPRTPRADTFGYGAR